MHKVHDIGDGCCALEMEVVPGGDLFQHLEACRRLPTARLPHDAVLRLSRQRLEALVYLHDELKWLHGDIKPQNILMQCSPAMCTKLDIDSIASNILHSCCAFFFERRTFEVNNYKIFIGSFYDHFCRLKVTRARDVS